MKNTTVEKSEQVLTKGVSRWGQDKRLEFIDFRLRWEGRFNRSSLTDFFGISVPQASLDIARYLELAPQNLAYDRSSRVYQITNTFQPMSRESEPQRYLNELLATANGVIASEASFIGWRPPVAYVPKPERGVDADTLAALLKAIREGKGVKFAYQSMSSPDPKSRIVSPHALAHDGFRWHVRAFCHSHLDFRDFVLGRILAVEGFEPAGNVASEDLEWNTVLKLILAPHPGLADGKRRVVELDYGMKEGEVTLECRQALLFYTLRRLGLNNPMATSPEAQQIVLKNRNELSHLLTV